MDRRPDGSTRNCRLRMSLLALFLAGCSAHQSRSSAPALDTKRLIQLPAQLGAHGTDKIVSALQARYGVSPGTPLSPFVNTKTPLALDDGMIIVQTVTHLDARDVRLDLAETPCLPIARAAGWIGAKRGLATTGSDSITGHVDYRFDSAEVRIDLTGEYGGQECLRVVEIYKH